MPPVRNARPEWAGRLEQKNLPANRAEAAAGARGRPLELDLELAYQHGMPPLMKQAYTCALTNRAFSAAASSALRCDSLGAVAAAAGAVAAAAADGGLTTGAAAGASASGVAPVTAANAEVSNEKVCGAMAAGGGAGSLYEYVAVIGLERRLAWPGLGLGAIRYRRLRRGEHADGGSGEHGGRRRCAARRRDSARARSRRAGASSFSVAFRQRDRARTARRRVSTGWVLD